MKPFSSAFFGQVGLQPKAIYKVPTAGWLQIFALAGAIEAWQNLQFKGYEWQGMKKSEENTHQMQHEA